MTVQPLHDVIRFADELLDAPAFADYGPNGLQVPGRDEVRKVVSGVSASLELLERAAAAGADLILVHHGLFWDGDERRLTPLMARRLGLLLGRDIALAAYHLPLDAHPQIGNNALLAEALGLERREPFAAVQGRPIGVRGRFPDGIAIDELIARVRTVTEREPLAFAHGPARVQTLGIVSGGAGRQLTEAIDGGLDAFLTGEPEEPAQALAREAGVHFIAAGHHATERLGVQRLGSLVAEQFGLDHEYIEVANPV